MVLLFLVKEKPLALTNEVAPRTREARGAGRPPADQVPAAAQPGVELPTES